MKKKKIAFLGGDKRELLVMAELIKLDYSVTAFAVPPGMLPEKVVFAESAAEAVKDADVVILPVCGLGKEGYLVNILNDPIYLSEDEFAIIDAGVPVFCGINSAGLQSVIADMPINLMETMQIEQIAYPLAIATAEAAVAVAISGSDDLLYNAHTLIIGYGRIGKELAWRLNGMGCNVSLINRSERRRYEAMTDGFAVGAWDDLAEYAANAEYLFNTVPFPVIDEHILAQMKRNALIVDLASTPGGVDFAAAEKLGIKAMLASGLPGKYSPNFAGQVLAKVYPCLIKEILDERGAQQ